MFLFKRRYLHHTTPRGRSAVPSKSFSQQLETVYFRCAYLNVPDDHVRSDYIHVISKFNPFSRGLTQ